MQEHFSPALNATTLNFSKIPKILHPTFSASKIRTLFNSQKRPMAKSHKTTRKGGFDSFYISSASSNSRIWSIFRSMAARRTESLLPDERSSRGAYIGRSERSEYDGLRSNDGRRSSRSPNAGPSVRKQSRHFTARPSLGKNGTWHGFRHSLHTASCISRGAGRPAPARFQVPRLLGFRSVVPPER